MAHWIAPHSFPIERIARVGHDGTESNHVSLRRLVPQAHNRELVLPGASKPVLRLAEQFLSRIHLQSSIEVRVVRLGIAGIHRNRER